MAYRAVHSPPDEEETEEEGREDLGRKQERQCTKIAEEVSLHFLDRRTSDNSLRIIGRFAV